MKKMISLECEATKAMECAQKLAKALELGAWVQLLPTKAKRVLIPSHLLPNGPGVMISSGGSSGGPHQCLLPCTHLNQSAIATGQWLLDQGLEPKKCVIFNPLPLHHVSGLMPWWRSRIWGAKHIWIMPSLMRDPIALKQTCKSIFEKSDTALLISLVPTQLKRLLSNPTTIEWLRSFTVIWVGGSGLSETMATTARQEGIQLAPCYGATETAAMVTVLTPQAFLAGSRGCGQPLIDVELSLNKDGALKVRTPRLAKAKWNNNNLEELQDDDGWWQSGDAAELTGDTCLPKLEIIGRIDTAIHSGGETVFPDKLETRLLEAAEAAALPVQALIFIPVEDQEWGQRLVALVRWQKEASSDKSSAQLFRLQGLVKNWLPAEKPISWLRCQELTPNAAGKWERVKWVAWLKKQQS